MKSKIVLVDMDGVIADFETGFIQSWKQKYPHLAYIPKEQRKNPRITDDYPQIYRKKVEGIYKSKGFFLSLPAVEKAKKGISELRDIGYEVFICSRPLTEYKFCVQEKYLWVEKHLGKDWIKKIILTKDKTLIRGNYLIEDWPEQLGLVTPLWQIVIFDQPYNREYNNNSRINWKSCRAFFKQKHKFPIITL